MRDVRRAVTAAIGEPSSCVPDGTVVMTMRLRPFASPSRHEQTGEQQLPVWQLQFAIVQSQECLMRRVISLCFDDEAAKDNTVSKLAWTRMPAKEHWATLGTGREKFGPIATALEVARAVFWLDPTAMLLRNPFDVLNSTAQADVRYVAEAPCWLQGGSAISSDHDTAIEGFCARTQVYDKIVLATNREVARALARLPYAIAGQPTIGLRSSLFANSSAGSGRGGNGADKGGNAFGLRLGSSFLRVKALPMPALSVLMHSYEAVRMGQILPCAASAYVANHLEVPSRSHRIPGQSGTSRRAREDLWASRVAAEMRHYLAAVRSATCATTHGPWRGWRQVARTAVASADPAIRVGRGERDEDVARRILHALRNAPVVHDALLRGLASLSPPMARDDLWMEFGSWKGRSTKLLMHGSCCVGRSARVHAFDSFRGLPERWRSRGSGWLADKFGRRGSFDLRGRPPFHDPRVRWHIGWFNETLVPFLAKLPPERQVSLVHIDSDLYSSASFALTHLAPRLAPNAVLCFDELINYPGYAAHEMRALIELLRARGLSLRVLGTTAYRIIADEDELYNLTTGCRGKSCLSGLGQQAVFQLGS